MRKIRCKVVPASVQIETPVNSTSHDFGVPVPQMEQSHGGPSPPQQQSAPAGATTIPAPGLMLIPTPGVTWIPFAIASISAWRRLVDGKGSDWLNAEKTKIFFQTLPTLPKHLLRDWLASVVSKVVVDMATKAIEIHVQLPKHMLESAFPSENAMRLVPTSASSTSYETHPNPLQIGVVDCRYSLSSSQVCYACRRLRQKAA